MSNTEKIQRYYDQQIDREWTRLERHPMEYAVTWRAMQEYIPHSADVLDIGGGPGRYSLELAKAGHKVTMIDLSATNVAFAQGKAAEDNVTLACYQADATDLAAFGDASFDAVLLMGPLYHLIEEGQRNRAVREAMRVLRAGGILFSAFINRFALIIDALVKDQISLIKMSTDRLMLRPTDGIWRTEDFGEGFTDSYFIHPQEIKPFMEGHGLSTLRLMAVEGLELMTRVRPLPDEVFRRLVDLQYDLGVDPVMWGYAMHLLYVAKKRDQDL